MPAKNRPTPISWPTRRLLMAEIENADALDDGPHPVTLLECLESVRGGYKPYDNFPAVFVLEELKLLVGNYGGVHEAEDFLSDRDWTARKDCNSSEAGESPLEVQVDYDLAAWVAVIAANNGIDTERYVNNLLEKAVLEEGGIGPMILNRSQTIGEHHVDAGATVVASQYHGRSGEADRFFKRQVQAIVNVDGKPVTVEGVVVLEDLCKPEDAADYATLELRVRAAVAGLQGIVKIEQLTSGATGTEEPSDMVRLEASGLSPAIPIVQALKGAGLIVYRVRHSNPPVLHIRG